MRLLDDDRGQDALEYILVLGAVVVAIVFSFMAFDALVFEVAGSSCPSVDTAMVDSSSGDCISTATPTAP